MKIIKNILRSIIGQKPYVYASIYLFLIPVFAVIYLSTPGPEIKFSTESSRLIQSLYFSIVTITTFGYGAPINSSAQIIASSESILGILTIGLFLNSLSHSLSIAMQAHEKKKETKSMKKK
ncbi:MAG: two pore domain potassium channel family protein [bacterium]|nr:two pore domain potassium channel family protein [bacterium]